MGLLWSRTCTAIPRYLRNKDAEDANFCFTGVLILYLQLQPVSVSELGCWQNIFSAVILSPIYRGVIGHCSCANYSRELQMIPYRAQPADKVANGVTVLFYCSA